jgi:catechol 2,3-dioxygenase-like lactoylglutathione lyase family enzyme
VKRLHVHVAVENIEKSVDFYSVLFAAPPTVRKTDYAKWMLDDPRVNFAISARGRAAGVAHLGIQVEEPQELDRVAHRLQEAGNALFDQGAATCCYARSEKAWVLDPSGISWETFLTVGESTTYGEASAIAGKSERPCCEPELTSLATPTASAV